MIPRDDLVTDGLAEISRRRHSILLAESKILHVPEFATRLYIVERGENIFASPRAPCGQIPPDLTNLSQGCRYRESKLLRYIAWPASRFGARDDRHYPHPLSLIRQP